MAVNISPLWGAGAQLFDNNGNVLSGGQIYTYAAGTTTPQVVYTTAAGNIAQTNPIILNSAGRVPTGEIWLTNNLYYKFVLYDANNSLIGTWDNINALYIDPNPSAANINYTPPWTGAVTQTVAAKLEQVVNVKDFGAVGDGITDDKSAIQNALNSVINGGTVYLPNGRYYVASSITIPRFVTLIGNSTWTGDGAISSPTSGSALQLDTINCSLILNTSATIYMNGPSCVTNLFIYASNLVGQTPFANLTAATNAISSYAGTAFTCASDDVTLTKLTIIGFNIAISSTAGGRQNYDTIMLDNTNGIVVTNSHDIGRINKCEAWPFLTIGYSYSNSITYRSGKGFYIYNGFDTGYITNSFAFGYSVGFQLGSGLTNDLNTVVLINCQTDSTSPNSNIGFYCYGGVHIWMQNCGSAAQTSGIKVDSNGSTNCYVYVDDHAFWGNSTSIESVNHVILGLNNCHFYYLSSGGTYHIVLDSSCLGKTLVQGNYFSTGNAINAAQQQINSLTYTNNIFATANSSINNSYSNIGGGYFSTAYNFYGGSAGIPGFLTATARGSQSSPTISQVNDQTFSLAGKAYDGSQFILNALIRGYCAIAPSANNVSGSILFSTNSGTTNTVDVLKLDQNGNLFPLTDNAYTCGVSGLRWSAIWAANGTIQTSDARAKTNVQPSILGLDFVNSLKPVSYKFVVGENKVIKQEYLDSNGKVIPDGQPIPDDATPSKIISEPVAGKRTHWGLLAQDVKAALPEGIDFGGWIQTDLTNPNSEQGLRYEEFIAPLIKAVQELSAKVAALEAK